MSDILCVRGVSRSFPSAHGAATLALQATDLQVAENDFVTILGPSGCGKSTLLRIVAGLDHPTGGEVLLDGKRIAGPGADRGMVFQSYTLFPWLTVLENLRFGLRERGLPRAESRRSPTASSPRSACAASRATSPSSYPEACSSAPRSLGCSSTGRGCCSWTSPSAPSTP